MAGKFDSVGPHYDGEPGVFSARTHGCDCCSKQVEFVTAEDMIEHIEQLKIDLEKAKKILKVLQKKGSN